MSKQNLPDLSIVIPAYNEEHRLPATLQKLATYVASVSFSCEAIVVVEPGTDQTPELAIEFSNTHAFCRVIANREHRGKGHAVRVGMLAARGNVVIFMDADMSVPVETLGIFREQFVADPTLEILVGNRRHAGSQIVRAQGWLRRSLGQTFNRCVRLLSGIPLRDTQCGFKAFRRNVARELFSRQTIDGFAFDVEILYLAQKLGYKMRDFPVEWRNSTDSHVHIVHDSLAMLRDVVRLRLKSNGNSPPAGR